MDYNSLVPLPGEMEKEAKDLRTVWNWAKMPFVGLRRGDRGLAEGTIERGSALDKWMQKATTESGIERKAYNEALGISKKTPNPKFLPKGEPTVLDPHWAEWQ